MDTITSSVTCTKCVIKPLQRWCSFCEFCQLVTVHCASHQQDMSLTLRNFQERLMAEGEKHESGEAQVRPCCEQGLGGRTLQSLRTLPSQELLRRIEELSSEVHRLKAGLKGDCKSSSSLRIWNETPQRPQDPRPSAVESYRSGCYHCCCMCALYRLFSSSARAPALTHYAGCTSSSFRPSRSK